MRANLYGSRLLRIIAVTFGIWAILVWLLASVESGHDGSSIESFADAAWYSLVTLTTVGYGDAYPVTTAGKVIGVLFLLGSLGVLGVLVFKVSDTIAQIREIRRMGYNGTGFTNHVIIIGWDEFARSVTTQLVNSDHRVAVITDRKDDVDLIRQEYSADTLFILFADLKNVSMLERAGIRSAGMIFANLPNDTDKLISILNIKKEYPDKNFVVILDNTDLKETFKTAGVTYILSRNEIASKLIASYMFEPDVAEVEADLMSSAKDTDQYDIQQYRVIQTNPYLNRTFGEAFADLKTHHNIVPIGICKTTAQGRQIIKLPPDDTKIEVGDYLIMIVNGSTEKEVSRIFQVTQGVF